MAKRGRPLKFKSVEDLEKKIDAYFAKCDEKEEPYTITGLCLALGTYRDVLLDYENLDNRKEFSNAIKRAKLRCQNYAEQQMYLKQNPAGPIFALKNYGWRDKQEIEHSGEMVFAVKKPDGI